VTLTCTVYNAGFFDVVRLTLTPRSTVALADMRPSVEFWTVSDNGHMKTEFSQLGRYSIGFRSLRSMVTVQLNITGNLKSHCFFSTSPLSLHVEFLSRYL
jgi:hypothetical protein